jgi:hypothetical protein
VPIPTSYFAQSKAGQVKKVLQKIVLLASGIFLVKDE